MHNWRIAQNAQVSFPEGIGASPHFSFYSSRTFFSGGSASLLRKPYIGHLRPLDSAAMAEPGWLRQQVLKMRLDIVTTAVPVSGITDALDGAPVAFCPPAAGPVPPGRLDSPEAAAFVAAKS